MKSQTPAANIVIGTLYLLIIIAICYVIKLTLKPKASKQSSKPAKYSANNLAKGLNNSLMQNNIQPFTIVLKSYALKHSLIGSFINDIKLYLLKEVFVMAIIGISCCAINWITLWPLALAIAFSIIFFVLIEFFKLPFIFNINPKIEQQNQPGQVQVGSEQVQIQPGLVVSENQSNKTQRSNKFQAAKMQQMGKSVQSWKYLICVSILSFVTLVLVSQTMFTIYNSISNLGALNIGSVVIVILIDQFACRPALGALLILTAKIILYSMQKNQHNYLQNTNDVKSNEKFKIFEILCFKNLCEQELLSQMNKIYNENGQSSDYDMGASPTRKKTFSPSKVPKAMHLQSETLMHLQDTKRIQCLQQQQKIEEKVQEQEQEQEQQEENNMDDEKSPIKQIEQSAGHNSALFTTVQKQMFNQENENDKLEINKSVEITYNTQKIKVNPNQYFSAQRLPKQELHPQFTLDEDGLVLVEAGLNLIKQRPNKEKPSTIDIDFSPTKKRKKPTAFHPKKRQLIITGSSPYLEYLPDMMKKDKHHKKNQTPSQPQIPTVSRKVL